MSENLSLDPQSVYDGTSHELFELVENRSCSQLETRLSHLWNSVHYLSILRCSDQQQVNLLMLAASRGYDDIVRVLLAYGNTDDLVELKGRIILSDGTSINGATALYFACYNGHFTVAKTLIELGHANVNQSTSDHPDKPLFIYAIITDHRDIIDFLLENKYADINETISPGYHRHSALICAIRNHRTSLAEYLISKGADINYTCRDLWLPLSPSPIVFAIEDGHIDIVRLLYHAGVNTKITNRNGDTLLSLAVQNKHDAIIDFLLDESINTIEDLELAAWSSIKEMQYTLEILKMAIERRERLNMPKICLEPIEVYDYQRECQTLAELDSIKEDPSRIYLEILLIRERIASSRNDISILKPLHSYGDILVKHRQFEQCLKLWIHMFYVYQKLDRATVLHRFIWLFCRMLKVNETIPVAWFLKVGRLVFEPSQTDKQFTIINAFFLVIIATRVCLSFVSFSMRLEI